MFVRYINFYIGGDNLLFPPISKEFHSALKTGTFDSLLIKEKLRVFNNILLSNAKANSMEESILFFIQSAYNISKTIIDSNDPKVKIVFQRTLFEIAVLFRLLSLSIVRNENINLFVELLNRFKDQGKIDEYSTLDYDIPIEYKEKIKYYQNLPANKRLEYEYDWLLPLFYREGKKKRQIEKLTFRELVLRTKEVDTILIEELRNYKIASQVVHCNFLQEYYANLRDIKDIEKSYNRICNCIIIDYLQLISKLYYRKNLDNPKINQLELYTKHLMRRLITE